jgi:hypothetical protein
MHHASTAACTAAAHLPAHAPCGWRKGPTPSCVATKPLDAARGSEVDAAGGCAEHAARRCARTPRSAGRVHPLSDGVSRSCCDGHARLPRARWPATRSSGLGRRTVALLPRGLEPLAVLTAADASERACAARRPRSTQALRRVRRVRGVRRGETCLQPHAAAAAPAGAELPPRPALLHGAGGRRRRMLRRVGGSR